MPEEQKTRINKLLSQLGVCSRREADKLIENKKVQINGKIAKLGDHAGPDDQIKVAGKLVTNKPVKHIYIAFHKPFGVITTTDKSKDNNILEYIKIPERVYPVGRLDVETSGLILLTNDGEIVNTLLKARNKTEKEYLVTLDKPVKPEHLKKMEEGMYLERMKITKSKDGVRRRVSMGKFKTLPAVVKKVSPNQISITIVQGMNRQVRRMCEALRYEVKILKRVRFAGVELGDLQRGKWRPLTETEIASLKAIKPAPLLPGQEPAEGFGGQINE